MRACVCVCWVCVCVCVMNDGGDDDDGSGVCAWDLWRVILTVCLVYLVLFGVVVDRCF
jgi:hypothetical protein